MAFRTLRLTCALSVMICGAVLGAANRAAADSIIVEWDASGGQVGYRVHVGTQSGSYSQHFDVGAATAFTFGSATAGQRYCFAVSAYALSSQLEGPNSAEICGFSNAPPSLTNPGNRTSTVGQAVTLQLAGSDPDAQALTYSATGLPPGLSVMGSTGFISGAGTTAGNYSVTVRASDGVLTASQSFAWAMTAPAGDTTRPTVSITTPTTGTSYSTTSASITIGGTAAANVGVTQVRWASDRGGSGVATGTTAWSAGIPLLSGSNFIIITAVDAAGNSATASLNVTMTVPQADTTRPTASIGSPTTGTTYSTTATSINIGGTAADNVGVTQVRWASDRGGSGVATGTTNWSATGIPLLSGSNVIVITAFDAAGNSGSASLSVSMTVPTADTTRPTVTIGTPTTGSTYSTTASAMTLGGSASDNVGVTQVRWANDRGGNGVASGTTTWSAAGIALLSGTNNITVTALDAAGNQSTDMITVTYTVPAPAPTTVTLSVDPRKSTRWRSARLSWTNAAWSSVDVYRNGMKVTNTPNDGTYTDPVWGRGTYTYQICAQGSTTTCSNTVTVYF
jgi:predicted secreted protein